MYQLLFNDKAKKAIAKWKKSNPLMFKKLNILLDDIMEHPRTGLGHPHPLVGGSDKTYSRHITAHDRLIYDIYDNVVEVHIIALEGHYDDK